MAALDQALAAFRCPVPRAVALALGFDSDAIDEAVASGHVVREGSRLRTNPLMVQPAAAEARHRSALDGVLAEVVPDDPLWSEAFRIDVLLDRELDGSIVERFCEAAVLRGTAVAATAAWIEHGLVPALVATRRAWVLRLLVEAGRLSEIEPLLGPDDWALRVGAHIQGGDPQGALDLLGDRATGAAGRLRARALLNLGRSAEADRALPSTSQRSGLTGVEHRELSALIAVEVGRWQQALGSLDDRPSDPWERLHLELIRARIELRLGHLKAARATLDRVLADLENNPSPKVRATAEFVGALVAFYAGNHERLEAQLRRLEDLGFLSTSTIWQHARAIVALSASDWETASEHADRIAQSNPYGVANMRAWIAIRTHQPDLALEILSDAAGDSVLYRQEVAWLRRLARKRRGEVVLPSAQASECITIRIVDVLLDAEIALDEGRAGRAVELADAAEALVVEHGAWVRAPDVQLLRADIAARSGDVDHATHELDRARARLPHPSGPAAEVIALARRRLSGEPGIEGDRRFVPPDDQTLRVGSDGAWFEFEGQRTDLGRKRVQRRLLAALVEARLQQKWLSMEELVGAGWPDERILPAAAANRLHVALNSLRKSGLRDQVVHGADGWSLDPATRVVRVL